MQVISLANNNSESNYKFHPVLFSLSRFETLKFSNPKPPHTNQIHIFHSPLDTKIHKFFICKTFFQIKFGLDPSSISRKLTLKHYLVLRILEKKDFQLKSNLQSYLPTIARLKYLKFQKLKHSSSVLRHIFYQIIHPNLPNLFIIL